MRSSCCQSTELCRNYATTAEQTEDSPECEQLRLSSCSHAQPIGHASRPFDHRHRHDSRAMTAVSRFEPLHADCTIASHCGSGASKWSRFGASHIIAADRKLSPDLHGECPSPPASFAGYPLEKVTDVLPKGLASAPLIGAAFVPPVSVEAVAKAAVQVRGRNGSCTVWGGAVVGRVLNAAPLPSGYAFGVQARRLGVSKSRLRWACSETYRSGVFGGSHARRTCLHEASG